MASRAEAKGVAAPPAEAIRLTRMGISAYHVTLTIDGDVVYLLTSNAAYRLVPGQPAQGIELDLGIGAVLTQSAFVFWSKGHIWRAPKEGGDARSIAKFPHRPQYFVASGEAFAWIDLSDNGLYTIQTLINGKPRVLVSAPHELSALTMQRDQVYFVERPQTGTYRIGVIRLDGSEPKYGSERKGRRPSMLTASDSVYYFDLDKTEIRRLVEGVEREETVLEKFVCSPINASDRILCGCVEGIFEVSKETHRPRVLSAVRAGPITNVASNEKLVAWTVDVGADQLAVDMLKIGDLDNRPTK